MSAGQGILVCCLMPIDVLIVVGILRPVARQLSADRGMVSAQAPPDLSMAQAIQLKVVNHKALF